MASNELDGVPEVDDLSKMGEALLARVDDAKRAKDEADAQREIMLGEMQSRGQLNVIAESLDGTMVEITADETPRLKIKKVKRSEQ